MLKLLDAIAAWFAPPAHMIEALDADELIAYHGGLYPWY